jgi:polar amino acid transport system substrate-binding protein
MGKISFEEASFTTLGAVALQGIRQAETGMGEILGVIGLGLLGLLTVQLLKANGCRVVGMDPSSKRCELAMTLGCDSAVSNEAEFVDMIHHWTGDIGVDAVLITAGTKSNTPIELAAEVCRDRGRIVAVGLVNLDVPRRPFYEKELDLRLSRSYGPGRYDPEYEEGGRDYPIGYVRWTENRNMAAFLDLLAQRKIQLEAMISHRFEIDEAAQAYDLITDKNDENSLGIVLIYPRADDFIENSPESSTIWLKTSKEDDVTVPLPKERKLQVGLIGTGSFAQSVLLPALKRISGVQLLAICNNSGPSARHLANKYGAAYCTSKTEELFNDENVVAVFISTRHDSHAELIIRGLEAGKHVYVEKPMALTELELEAVKDAYGEYQDGPNGPLMFMVGFNRRFAPMAIHLKEFFDKVKEPLVVNYQVNAGYIMPNHWVHDLKIGGGRIIGELCHFMDFLLFLTGAQPVSVFAQALPNVGRYQDDNVVTTVRFSNGSLGTILYTANGNKAFPKEKITVFGGGLTAELDDYRSLTLARKGRITKQKSRLKQDKGHQSELEAFIRVIQDNLEAPIQFNELISTTQATFNVVKSLKTGKVINMSG